MKKGLFALIALTLFTAAFSVFASANKTIVVDGTIFPQTSSGINSAVSLCGTKGIRNVYLPEATYTMNSTVTPVSHCRVYGAGKGRTQLVGSVPFHWLFYRNSPTQLTDFTLSDMTIDLQNGQNAGAVHFSNVRGTVVQNVAFLNGAAGGWFLYYGVNGDGTTAPIQNFDNLIEDVDFTNHEGSLEALLVFNATNTSIVRPRLANISSPGIGLWQKTYNTTINDFSCHDSTRGQIYYSITTEGTTINNPRADNCHVVIQGANISDNGRFGLTQAQNIAINNPIFHGGPNSTETFAIQLGAVNEAHVINPTIDNYLGGISVDMGNNGADAATTNWSVTGGSIYNNNASNNYHILHPAIIIFGTATGGAAKHGVIEGVQIYDDQLAPTQKYPIVFYGNALFEDIMIRNNRLSAPLSLGGTSIALVEGAVLDPSVLISGNTDYSGTPPQL